MNRGARARARVAQDDGHAVGGLDAEQDARRVGRERVAAFVVAGVGRLLAAPHRAHLAAVNLPAGGERPVALEEREEAAAVLYDVRGRVLVEAREVEIAVGERADSAGARREGVREARAFERDAGEGAHTGRERASGTRSARAPCRP